MTDHSSSIVPQAGSTATPSTVPPPGSVARRWLTVAAVGLGGTALGYGLSLAMASCTTCATGSNPVAFAVVLGAVSAWSAHSALV